MEKWACALVIMILFVSPAHLFGGRQDDEWAARQLYLEDCAVCHGFDRIGFVGVSLSPSNLTALSEAAIRSLVRHGISDTLMPAWDCRLTLRQLRQISRYLKETPAEILKKIRLSAGGELEILEEVAWWADPERTERGGDLFVEYCMGCHHPEFEAFAPPYRSIARKRTIREIVGQIKFPYTSSRILGYSDQGMPKFDLTDNEIRDLGSYVYHFRDQDDQVE